LKAARAHDDAAVPRARRSPLDAIDADGEDDDSSDAEGARILPKGAAGARGPALSGSKRGASS